MSLMNHAEGQVILLNIVEILDALFVPFFLFQGTALGAVRDRGFTPTERDIDVGVLWEDLKPKSWLLLRELVRSGYDVEAFVRPFTRVHTVVAWAGGVKVDLVGLVSWRDKRFTPQPVRSWTEDYALVHRAEQLEMTEPVTLFGRTFRVPSPVGQYLESEYGPDWRTPRDDHVSRLRVPGFLKKEGVPLDLLEP